jgi:hypothetical protein
VDQEQALTGFPNLLIIVPEVREEEVVSALRHAIGSLHVGASLATSFPLYAASEEQLTKLGVLGAAWQHLPTDGDRLSLGDLPAQPRDLYRASRCLGRYFTDERARRRISPVSTTLRFTARSDMPPDAVARRRAKDRAGTPSPSRKDRQGFGRHTRGPGDDTCPDYACASWGGQTRASRAG